MPKIFFVINMICQPTCLADSNVRKENLAANYSKRNFLYINVSKLQRFSSEH